MRAQASLLARLQWGFALGAFLMAGAMALFMEAALRRSFDSEDTLVLGARAREISASLEAERSTAGPPGARDTRPPSGPEHVAWRLVGPARRGSADFPDLDEAAVPMGDPVELEVGGRAYVALRHATAAGDLLLVLDRSHEASLVSGFRRTLLLAVGFSAMAAALLGRIVASRGLRPLGLLAEEAAGIRPGSLGHRLDPGRYPVELGQVVQRLNEALAGLEEAFERLSGLAGDLAHELRTPIQTLRSEAEALVRSGSGPAEALGSILEECDRLAGHVEQMLFLARAEDREFRLRRAPVEVRGLLEEGAAFYEAAAEEAGVALAVEAPEGIVVDGDRPLLARALHNLLSNALRHTLPGGIVRLEAGSAGPVVWIAVRDTGPGLDPALAGQVGRRWAKGSGSGGLGLGLAIVQNIARIHGGRMEATTSEAGGAMVRMEIPYMKKT